MRARACTTDAPSGRARRIAASGAGRNSGCRTRVAPDGAKNPQSPEGRDWASNDTGAADSTLLLFPSWWPAEIAVALPARTPAVGDPVSGTAYALVARGDIRAPETRVRAWRVPCRRPEPAPATDGTTPAREAAPAPTPRPHAARRPAR